MHPNETALNEYIDDALEPSERTRIDLHLESCGECRRAVADLREIYEVARTLDPRQPPVRAWTRIERAIKLERESLTPVSAAGEVRRQGPFSLLAPRRRAWLAAAAVLVVAVAVGARFMPGRGTAPAQTAQQTGASDAAPASAAQSVESELRLAEAHYEKAIKGLEQIAKDEQGVFDPRTAATLQKNLALIDQAISESRAALRTEPASEPAQQSLLENFKTKIALLQDTVALINEMRKGNDAGAARIVSGLKEKGN